MAGKALPTGVVTFVFTDVEGSTGLLASLGARFPPLLQRHREILRSRLAEHGGHEVKSEGDGLFLAFGDAGAAATWAVDAQRALASEQWPGGARLSVRMGLHTGEAIAEEDDYISLAVNLAARICAAAHGGQVVASDEVASAAGGGVEAHELGWFTLRGSDAPARLTQLQPSGEPRTAFPPLRPAQAVPVTELLEREPEQAALATALSDLRKGAGGAVLLEGQPGIGKTALLDAALVADAGHRLSVLRCHGTELESGLAFGGVRQLLGPPLMALADHERETVLSGPAALAAPVLGLPGELAVDPDLADPLYGLYWLLAALAERTPQVIAIDDLHWLDAESLRFVGYLLERLEGLPVLVLATARAPEPGVTTDATAVQAAFPETVRPAPLSSSATGRLLADRPGDEVHRVTGGNPLLIVELGRALAAAATDTPLEQLGSPTVARLVLGRVAKMSPQAGALARAVCLFPDGAELGDAAAVAELERAAAEMAADELIAVQVFAARERLAFLHPMMGAAVYGDLGTFARGGGHLRAAQRLRERGADVEEIAAHLLNSLPGHDAESARILLAAAEKAVAAVAPRAAIRYLERALAEDVLEGEARQGALLELGRLQSRTGHPDAQRTLKRAFTEAAGTPRHAEAGIELSGCAFNNLDLEVVKTTAATVAGSDATADERLAMDMLRHEVAAAEADMATATTLVDRVPRDLPGDTPAQRLALVELAILSMLRCEPVDDTIAMLLRGVGDRGSSAMVAGADLADPLGWLLLCGAIGEAEAFAEERRELARETGNETLFATTHFTLGWAAQQRGALHAAESWYRYGLEQPALPGVMQVMCRLNLAGTLIARGAWDAASRELDAAEALSGHGMHQAWTEGQRAEIAAWKGDHAAAIEPLERRRAAEAPLGLPHPNLPYWFDCYADCLVGLGRHDEAVTIIRELVDRSVTAGGVLGAGMHRITLGRLTSDLAELERAHEILEPSEYRWYAARARLELGAALRGAGTEAAVPHLEAALAYADAERVEHFAARAREELVLAGAEPAPTPPPPAGALSPEAALIARLAAEGATDREIAQRLFLTVHAVERARRG